MQESTSDKYINGESQFWHGKHEQPAYVNCTILFF
jgi:hypothetical protein